jgi:diguanylate cyclase (GGDEF)-like protein
VFIGASQKILAWNRAAEALVGINGQVAGDLDWLVGHLQLGPRQGRIANANDVSVRDAVVEQVELLQYVTMAVDGRPPTPVDIQVVPLLTPTRRCLGSLIIIHDASYKVNLQQQVQELMEKTISDPLTGIANRAEFERILETCCQHYRASHSDLSLIICDIDFFKRINDTYGHPIGDEARVKFASFLQRSTRDADFLARFGGEEFVIVCNDCNGQAAVDCAEKIRGRLQITPLACLGQKSLSASFGVTQFCRDDTPSTFFARADQALLRAKEDGRNRVVLSLRHDSGGTNFVSAGREADGWLPTTDALLCQHFSSSSPMEVRGQVGRVCPRASSEIMQVESNRVVIHTGDEGRFRRSNDRRVGFKIDESKDLADAR